MFTPLIPRTMQLEVYNDNAIFNIILTVITQTHNKTLAAGDTALAADMCLYLPVILNYRQSGIYARVIQ